MNRYLRARSHYCTLFPDSFIERSGTKVTQTIIDGLGMVVKRDGKRMFEVKPTMSKTSVKAVLKSIK